MTTDNDTQRDMKTTDYMTTDHRRQTTDRKQQAANSLLAKAMLVTMLFLAGGW